MKCMLHVPRECHRVFSVKRVPRDVFLCAFINPSDDYNAAYIARLHSFQVAVDLPTDVVSCVCLPRVSL